MSLLVRLVVRVLPAAQRESIVGDLEEEAAGRGPGWIALQLLKVAAHLHADCYRDTADAARIALLLAAAGGVWAALPPAAALLLGSAAEVFRNDAVSSAALMLWRQPGLVAAVAAGLIVGRLPGLTRRSAPARWHVAVLLMAAAAWRDGALAAGLLAAALWIADHNRRPEDPARPA